MENNENNEKEKTEKEIIGGDAAATYIGLSRRTFERLNIPHREEFIAAKDGKKRKQRVYDISELDRIKAERETPQHTGALELPTNANRDAQVGISSDVRQFAGMLIEGLGEQFRSINEKFERLQLPPAPDAAKPKKQIDISAFKDKLILSFPQAQIISGLPSGVLKQALDENKIKFKKVGRRRYVQRESLEEFCRDYFTDTEE